ncbi:FtsX-like permease family protein [Saccharibacter sp. 17.LH.SD]|uniref:ABC transporter permease n=1 Tax=Saccharibacter sp. 17.LH.SD TaxID=2689393 RepID=UPI00136C833D|nr:FtsX-like permease family protein [Saccharibacter sp. 17.LH.SD]MXV44876.1 FtsX-like permease family protein [Saccharibacter sp. 17.LH.SD]
MLTTIFRSVVRQGRRHPLYIGINVFGLALGIGVFLTLAMLVRFEYGYNSGLKDVDRLVRVDTKSTPPGNTPTESESTSFYAVPFLKEDFPEIEESVRFQEQDLQIQRNGEFASLHGGYVDPSFMTTFQPALMQGTQAALMRPDGLVLSQSAANRLFGTTNILGRSVTLNNDGEISQHVVTGVLRASSIPSFLSDIGILAPIRAEDEKTSPCYTRWASMCGSVYLKLRQPSDIAAVQARLRDFIIRRASGSDDNYKSLGPHPEKTYSFKLVPMRDARFYDAHITEPSRGLDQNVLNGIGAIGLLALFLACANVINFGTARSVLRAREVAIRKTLGATRKMLFLHFMGESLVITACSAILGFALSEILVQEIASLTGENIRIAYDFVLEILPLTILICGCASGIYPSLILSGYQPAHILASARMPSGGRKAAKLRNGLVIFQFSVSAVIIIIILVIHQQTLFLQRANQGYVTSGLLIGDMIPSHDIAIQRRIKETLRTVPGVQASTFGSLAPKPEERNMWEFDYISPHGTAQVNTLQDTVDNDYVSVYQPQLIAGRWFDLSRGQDQMPNWNKNPNTISNVVINATAVSRFGFIKFSDAIGKIIESNPNHFKARIIGVLDDMRFESPREPVRPRILFFNSLTVHPYFKPIPAVRFSGVPVMQMEQRLQQVWGRNFPNIYIEFQTPTARMEYYVHGDEQREHIFTLGACTAVIIAVLGLYGLASFAAARRVYEIGIRKTLGATAKQIMLLLLTEFLRPVIIACIIACPIAWVLMREWLSGFNERITLGPTPFIIALFSALLIATLTVLGQTLRLAYSEPARALKTE